MQVYRFFHSMTRAPSFPNLFKKRYISMTISLIMDEYSDENVNFLFTFMEAVANHVFGDDLIMVQQDEHDPRKSFVVLHSSPDEKIEFDWLGYIANSENDNLENVLHNFLIPFMRREDKKNE